MLFYGSDCDVHVFLCGFLTVFNSAERSVFSGFGQFLNYGLPGRFLCIEVLFYKISNKVLFFCLTVKQCLR